MAALQVHPAEMIGQTIAHYRVTAKLGAGGMGEVHRASDTMLGRDVALKVLPENVVSDPAARERLLNEARTASALNHPHICTIHEVGEADGQIFIAMEYVEGRPLSALIGSEGLPAESAIRYGMQMADALEHAHQRGVVHRDLKSSNVVITPEGRAKILDFGLARHLEKELTEVTRSRLSLAEAGTVVGTLQYMAPEVLQGKEADARSDVWSLGVTLYEMAAGALPFRGETGFELSSAILRDAPRPLPASIPAGLGAVVQHCLAKSPGERYQRAGEVRAALETLQSGVHVPTSSLPASRFSRRWFLGVGAAVALVVLLALAWGWRDRLFGPAVPRIDSLAVLPLANLSGDPEQDYFAAGMHEALITDLAKLSGLRRVIARSSVMRYEETDQPLPQIARELNVDAVITGSVLRVGNRVRITAQLINAATEEHLWADHYERDLRDVLALQSEVARAIAREIQVTLTPQEEIRLASARPVNPAAHEAYLLGNFYVNKLTEESIRKGIAQFKKAIEIDPNFALAYAGLANAHTQRGIWGEVPFAESALEARAAITKALELDDNLPEAHVTLGSINLWYDWEWKAADEELQRALELNPNSVAGHVAYAYFLLVVGRVDRAVQHIERARELDPLSADTYSHAGRILYRARRYDRAAGYYLRSIELDPLFVPTYGRLADVYEMLGEHQEARAALEQGEKLAGRTTLYRHRFGYHYAITGERQKALETIEMLKGHRASYLVALIYAGLGEKNQAVFWLERSVQERQPTMFLRTEPKLDPLRDDPRFQSLLRRMNFPE